MTSDISHSFFQVVEDLSLSCLSELERPGSPSPRRSTQAEDSAQRPVDFRELSEWARVIPPFKLHYDLAYTDNILDILKTIEQELSTHTYIHDWDEKICPDPVKALALYAKNEMGRRGLQNGSHLINYSSVDRVCTVNGENYRMHVARDVQDVKKHFFESEAQYLAIENQYRGRNSAQPRSSYGRVTLIKESIQEAERSTLLLLHAFSIRLHNEDFTFIQRFVQRHLDLKAVYRGPLRFQDASPSYNISVSFPFSSFCRKIE
ncbi:hypothetical protein MMC25_006438 [Agyrium rufum]|nr:hypothetical protein [Agyrium rufum]